MKEFELQALVFEILNKFTLSTYIENFVEYSNYKINFKNFSYKSILSGRYCLNTISIIQKLESGKIEFINGETPKNISLDKKDRLFPDIIGCDYDKNFFIFELKVGSKTEREAITEIFAYIFELRNHLPHLNNHEISIIIIAENFGTLLSHAILQCITFFGIKLLCLKFSLKNKILSFNIVNPVNQITENEKLIHKNAFSTYSMCLYSTEEQSENANHNIDRIFRIAESMIIESANRLGSNGFLYLINNTNFDCKRNFVAKYYITISLINPFEILNKNLLFNRNTKLSNYLYNKYRDGT